MSLCTPAAALSSQTRKGCWRLVEYEAESGKGILMYALPGVDAPDVEYPLRVKGWHSIYVGL